MSQQVTVTNVETLAPWSKDGKTFHSFLLTTDELDKPVKINRLPTSPEIQAGQQVWLDQLQVDAGRPTQFKARVGKDPAQGGFANGQQAFSGGGSSRGDFHPGTQSAIKSAVAYAAAFTNPPSADEVILVAKQFFAAMEEMERGDG